MRCGWHRAIRVRQWLLRSLHGDILHIESGGIKIIPSLICADGADAGADHDYDAAIKFANRRRTDSVAYGQRTACAEGDWQAGTSRSVESHSRPFRLISDWRKGDRLLREVDCEGLLNGERRLP